MIYSAGVWSLMVIAIREFTHEELLAAKYTECEAQKHSKGFIYVFVLFHIKHRSSFFVLFCSLEWLSFLEVSVWFNRVIANLFENEPVKQRLRWCNHQSFRDFLSFFVYIILSQQYYFCNWFNTIFPFTVSKYFCRGWWGLFG